MRVQDIAPAATDPVLAKMASMAGCATDCRWQARSSLIHNGVQIRHGGGEAVIVPEIVGLTHEIPEDIARWLKTLHPK